jgi:hypothetical protein
MNQPLSGSAMFQVYSASGALLAEVGVASATPLKQFNLIADSMSFFDTGIALANPNEENQDSYVSATLRDKSGAEVSSAGFLLGVNKHRALFRALPESAQYRRIRGNHFVRHKHRGRAAFAPLGS